MAAQEPRGRRIRTWLLVVAAACVVIVAVIAAVTHGFGLMASTDRASPDRTAQDSCTSEVLKRLASPSTATLSRVETARAPLEPDGKDLFSLLDELKGVEHSRITVLNVSGVVDAPNAFGTMIHSPFSCRAYFVDGNLAHSLVLLDHGD